MRIRSIVVAVSMVGLAVGLTACGAAAGRAGTDAGPVAKDQVAAAGVTDAVAGDVDAPASLTAEFSVQRTDVALITLTNNGSAPVTVQGWPALNFTNAHGDSLEVPVEQVEVPAPGEELTVAPGGSVFAPVTWTSGDKADLDTFVADGVAVIPPGSNTEATTKVTALDGSEPGYYEFALKSVKIGTFQGSTHNILSF